MSSVWIQQHKTFWASHARQDIAVGGVFEGLYTDGVGAFRVDGGGYYLIPVVTPGAYTVAPTVVIPAANGYTTARVNAVATVTLVSGGLGVVVFSNIGKSYISSTTPTLTGGTGTGGALGTPTLQGNTLQQRYTGTTGAFGSAPLIIYNAGLIGQNQRCIAVATFGASTDKLGLAFRINLSSNSHISINFTGTKTQIWLMKNGYNGVTGTATLLGDTGTITAPGIGQKFSVDAAVESTSTTTTTITVTITNVTTSAVLGSVTKTTSDVEVQSAGRVGLGFVGTTTLNVETLEWFNAQGVVTASVTSLPAHSTNNVDIVGAGTDFVNFPPTMSSSYATLNFVTVVDATHATLNITTGDTAGLLTIQDPTAGQFITIAITGINAPPISRSLPTLLGATLNYGSGFTNGTAPYGVSMHRSQTSGFVPGDAGSVQVNSQGAVGEGVTPASPLDNTASPGVNFYVGKAVDVNGLIAYTKQTQAVVLKTYTGYKALLIGDSITEGNGAGSIFNKRLTRSDVTVGGTGYTGELSWVITDVPCLRKAVVGGSIRVGNIVKGIYFSDGGDGYTSASLPTISGTGGGGSGVVMATPVLGGGHARFIEMMLQSLYGNYYIPVVDAGVAGSQAGNWLPIGQTAGGITNTAYYFLQTALLAAGGPSVCPIIVYGLAINDSNIFHQITPANYILQVKATVDYLIGLGYKVIIKYPTYPDTLIYAGTDAASIRRLQLYITQIVNAVIDYSNTNSNSVFLLPCDLFTLFAGNLDLNTSDGLHPGPEGHSLIGAAVAMAIAAVLRLRAGRVGPFGSSVIAGGS